MSRGSKAVGVKNVNNAEEAKIIDEIHNQVNQVAKRKLKDQVIIQSAVPAVVRQPLH